jgi:maltooligosyltrehalose trehalohydrolase
MERDTDGFGFWSLVATDVGPGTRYRFQLDGGDMFPDPASRFQPEGVHGPSEILDPALFRWTDSTWSPPEPGALAFYELHVGTFTQDGTFESAIDRLDDLAELGINAIEIMPIAQFPGSRNWGYDGVQPYAAQASYGGPTGFQRLVDACHARGIAVCLDVVYNHFGPEGNYLGAYCPLFFTNRYKTHWGEAVNFDGPFSDHVRSYFIGNALFWLRDFHVDILRLDATHAIHDESARPFLEEMADEVRAFGDADGRRRLLIAESDANDPRVIRPAGMGGLGLDAQWSDDFHHSVHVLLTGEQDGYFAGYKGLVDLPRVLERGQVYEGQYAPHRLRRHGRPAPDRPGRQFVVCVQNHDQVGNRMLGERLASLASFEQLKFAAAVYLTAPFVPLLFMGEEHGETNPFLYFVSHGDPALVKGVREGRKKEFKAFGWKGEPPDPQSEETFDRSRPDWSRAESGPGARLRGLYTELLRLRRTEPALHNLDREATRAVLQPGSRLVHLERHGGDHAILCLFNAGDADTSWVMPDGMAAATVLLHTVDVRWGGSLKCTDALAHGSTLALPGWSAAVLRREEQG